MLKKQSVRKRTVAVGPERYAETLPQRTTRGALRALRDHLDAQNDQEGQDLLDDLVALLPDR
jgi:hypothetical protein